MGFSGLTCIDKRVDNVVLGKSDGGSMSKKTAVLTVRLTEDEKWKLQDWATEAGISMSDLVLQSVKASCEFVRGTVEERALRGRL